MVVVELEMVEIQHGPPQGLAFALRLRQADLEVPLEAAPIGKPVSGSCAASRSSSRFSRNCLNSRATPEAKRSQR